jgi:hypothetical protein
MGSLVVGDSAREPAVGASVRYYGTRDLVLGVGTLRALARDGDAESWILAGIGADLLDAVATVADWESLPPDRRIPALAAALGAAAGGAALIIRSD